MIEFSVFEDDLTILCRLIVVNKNLTINIKIFTRSVKDKGRSFYSYYACVIILFIV